jgi:hypothetical protein
MNHHDDLKTLLRAPAGDSPDDGFTERVMRRLRQRARRRRAILAAATILASLAALAAAWALPAHAPPVDMQSTIAVLLLAAASGLVAIGTETCTPRRHASINPCRNLSAPRR